MDSIVSIFSTLFLFIMVVDVVIVVLLRVHTSNLLYISAPQGHINASNWLFSKTIKTSLCPIRDLACKAFMHAWISFQIICTKRHIRILLETNISETDDCTIKNDYLILR